MKIKVSKNEASRAFILAIFQVEHVLVDFDDLEASRQVFERPDVAICCLGTTRGKSGVEGLWKIDYEYVVNCAKLLKAGGKCNDFHLVTANGKP